MKKILFLITGCISLIIGVLTTVTPFPTIPFLIVASLCFAHSTERVSNWFENTKLYRERIQPILEKKRQ
jgi:uncharacterized membrane protein YbaN (DUF454 family)